MSVAFVVASLVAMPLLSVQESVIELVREYSRSAAEAGRLDIPSRRQNRAADRVAAVYRELRDRDQREALLPLLGSDNPGVRGWAAAHALEFAPEKAISVLEASFADPFPHGFNAEMTLKEWRAGRLRFP